MRESTVDWLSDSTSNQEYVALYILDSAAAHIDQDEDAREFLLAHHSKMAREYDSQFYN